MKRSFDGLGWAIRSAAAVALGLVLGSLPFVYYRYGVGRHHARHEAAEVPRTERAASEGVDRASPPR